MTMLFSEPLAHLFDNRVDIRVLLCCSFGMHELAVDDDFMATAGRRDEHDTLDLAAKGRDKRFRQTDGAGQIVSHRAEFNCNFHSILLVVPELLQFPHH